MTHYIRSLIFTMFFLLSMTSYAVDHITCKLSKSGIPSQTQTGKVYENTYMCNNTYPKSTSFPPIHLVGTVLGDSAGISVSRNSIPGKINCATQKLASNQSCEFVLKANFQKTGKVRFDLRVSVGSLYYIDLPHVNTTVSPPPPPPILTWPGSTEGSALVDSSGSGSGTYVANAKKSSGNPITYTFALSGTGVVIGSQNGTFSLSGIIPSNPGTVTVTATSDDTKPVVGTPINISVTGSTITWHSSNVGSAQVDMSGKGSGSYVPDATDSLGLPITYTFKLSGTGKVMGNQGGSFTLSGINTSNPGTVTVTATAQGATSVEGKHIKISVSTSPFITWPGSNSGSAQADSSGHGSGTYVADAKDSSGQTVTYTFALSGTGAVTGTQHGSFTLSGLNLSAPGTVTVTANAKGATPVVGTPIGISTSQIPFKTIAFFNNTNETIYPIIEAPILKPADNWLQAQFKVTDINTFKFVQTNIHRAYVNGTKGIAAGQTVLVKVPFFSNLVKNPTGSTPNQCIDWWNAMRVYLYDGQAKFMQQFKKDSTNPVKPLTPGPSCISGCSTVDIFSSVTGVPTNDPQQLTEYTFANVFTSQGIPFPIDYTHVDYDYSAVDQIYLPLAMEPFGTSLVGYTGTTVGLTPFRNSLNNFLKSTKWPVYSGLPPTTPRVPGAYNVMIANSQLTNPQPQINALTTNWNTCLADTGNVNHKNCVTVRTLFQNNAAACGSSPTELQLLQNIYGYVSFCAAQVLPSKGPQFMAYTNLQHNFLGYPKDFNPYTQLIHQTLQMNVYAYSVDDAVGNINTIGDGVVLAIGGGKGLSNPVQYDPTKVTTVEPGYKGGGHTYFAKFGVCSSKATNSLNPGGSFPFQLPNSKYPCLITLEDSNNKIYQFTVKQSAPFPTPPTSKYISCSAGNTWCQGVLINFMTHLDIGTPAPNE